MIATPYEIVKVTLYDSAKLVNGLYSYNMYNGELPFGNYSLVLNNYKLYYYDRELIRKEIYNEGETNEYFELTFIGGNYLKFNKYENFFIKNSTYIRSKSELTSVAFPITFSKLLMNKPFKGYCDDLKEDYYCHYILERMFLDNDEESSFELNKFFTITYIINNDKQI